MKNLIKMMVGTDRERFRVFYFYFLLFILAFSCSKDDSAPGGGKIETGSFTEALNENVGIQGKVLTVQGGDVDGLTIEIPQGSYKSGKDFVISTAKINSHTFGPDFNPITPMIRINNGGGYADSILTVTIPCVVPPDHFAMGFYYDEETGELEGIPILAINDSNVVLATRHFSGKHLNEGAGSFTVRAKVWTDIVVSMIELKELYINPQISGFEPGVDDWEFTNYGSYIAPKGHCAGQSLTAMWYYSKIKQKRFAPDNALFEEFSRFPGPWEDNRNGYRFASVVQNIYRKNWDDGSGSKFGNFFNQTKITSKWPRSLLHYLAFAYSIQLTEKPQFVDIRGNVGGHVMIIYMTDLNKMYVADPNYPGEERYIEIVPGTGNYLWKPYESKPNANEPATLFPGIYYYAKSALISSEGIAEQYDKMLKGTIGDDPPYAFPRYQLIYYDGIEWQDLPTTLNTEETSLTVAARCFQCANRLPGDLTYIYLVNSDGGIPRIVSNDKGLMTINLKPGENVFGFVINGYDGPELDSKKTSYVDFLLDTINVSFSPLTITPNPINVAPDQEIDLTAKSISTPPSSANYVWTFGDGTTETILNKNTVKHKYAKAGDFLVTVKLYDNSTNKLLSVGTATAKIEANNDKTFDYKWLSRKSTKDWLYDINFNISGSILDNKKNKVEEISENKNSNIVTIKFANIDSFKINFTSSFSVTPTQVVSILDPKEVLTFQGTPRMSWSTSNFVPGASQNVGYGTFENAKSQGAITIKGYMDYTSTWYDDNIGEYKTTSGTNEWVLGYIQFEKY